MDLASAFRPLAIALGLGLLVGLQRERAEPGLAGLRTFPLITLFGVVCAFLAGSFGGWVLAAGFLALAALVVMGNLTQVRQGPADPGLTTEVAILLMYAVGAFLVIGPEGAAVAVGGGTAVLLQYKARLHGIAQKLGDDDLKAIMQFALISLVILPVLPNRTYGPYSVWNPREIWWMVVLIVGISLGGYIAYKFFGERAGVALGGILGGTISSTATTVSYARRTAGSPEICRQAATVVMIASSVVALRILVEIGVVARGFLPAAAPPVAVMFAILALLAAVVWRWHGQGGMEMAAHENPSELRSALFFGTLYAAALLAVATAKDRFGSQGLYVVAALSGLTDMDAITLSTSRLVETGILHASDGWRVIIVGMLSNLLFKGGIVAVLGHRALLAKVAPLYGAALGAGALLLALWPR